MEDLDIPGRCFTCHWSNWDWGGRCTRPEYYNRKHRIPRDPSDPALPIIRKLDYCGDHITLAKMKSDANPRNRKVVPIFEDVANEEMTGSILEILRGREQRLQTA